MTMIKDLAIECANEAWAVLLQGATVSRVDGEVVSDNGTETRPVKTWEPMAGDWEALDNLLGYHGDTDDRYSFERSYMERLREIIHAVDGE